MTYVRVPVNDPCTGRYAVFSPTGKYAKWPNPEDHFVIAKQGTGEFKPVFATYVPWDEAPLQLWDDVENPDRLVVYHGYHVIYSLDGGRSFRGLSEGATEMLAFERLLPTKLMAARFGERCLELEIGEWHVDWHEGTVAIEELAVWEIGLDEDDEPVKTDLAPTEGAREWRRDRGTAVREPTHGSPLHVNHGDLMSWDPEVELFEKVPLARMLKEITEAGPSNFFGVDGVRSLMR